MTTLEHVGPALLDRQETRRFQAAVAALPKSILSVESVESERERVRNGRDVLGNVADESEPFSEESDPEVEEIVNGIYKVLKNNQIMGQILWNRYGNMAKDKVEEIVEIMSDGGLRLVNVLLKDEDEILRVAQYVHAQHPEYDIDEVRRDLEIFSFVWTMMNLDAVVKAINVPEIRSSIKRMTEQRGTAAHDIIMYFVTLDTAPQLTTNVRNELDKLWKEHRDSVRSRSAIDEDSGLYEYTSQ